MSDLTSRIEYSEKYQDESFEYRHVMLPKELAKPLNKARLLSEAEWRGIGVQQSRGWEHYAWHKPEPHILLFRRALGTDPVSGKIDPVAAEAARQAYFKEFGAPEERNGILGPTKPKTLASLEETLVISQMEAKEKEDSQREYPIRVRRLAIKYDPPMLVVEVLKRMPGAEKVYSYQIKMKHLPPSSDPVTIALKLRQKYPDVLSVSNVPDEQLQRLVRMILDGKPVGSTRPVSTTALRPSSAAPLPAPAPTPSTAPSTASTERSGPPAGFTTLLKSSSAPTAPAPSPSVPTPSLENYKLPDMDLQRVDPSVVVAAKKAMDVVFEVNRKRPGDPGYVYNVEVEFEEGQEDNEWDED